MKVFGNPNQKKQELKNLIKNLTLDERYLFKKKDFRKEILKNIDKNMTLLDVGKSMRDYFDEIVCVEKKTLDINIFENYPDFQFDLSEDIEIEKSNILLAYSHS